MTIRRNFVLVWPLLLLVLVFASRHLEVEGSRYHRLRHRHDLASRRAQDHRGHPWSARDADYEDAFAEMDEESGDELKDDGLEAEKDYEVDRARAYRERLYRTNKRRQKNYRSRFEPYYPSKRHRASHGWYRRGIPHVSGHSSEDEPERRRWHHDFRIERQQRQGRERSLHEDRRTTSGFRYPPDVNSFLEDDAARDRISGKWRFAEEEEDVDGNDYDDDDDDDDDGNDGDNDRNANENNNENTNDDDDDVEKDRRTIPKLSGTNWRKYKTRRDSRILEEERNERRWRSSMARTAKHTGRFDLDQKGSEDSEKNGNVDDRKTKRVRTSIERRKGENWRDYDDAAGNEADEVLMRSESHRVKNEDELKDEAKDESELDDENVWKDSEDTEEEKEEDEDEEGIDNFDATNYYKTEDEPPYKTFDDIIKSLTFDDPTTLRPTIRREYRNIAIEKYLKRDAYGNIYDSRNVTPPRLGHEASSRYHPNAKRWRYRNDKPDLASHTTVNDGKKIFNAIADTNHWRTRNGESSGNERKKVHGSTDEAFTRTRSVEQDYDEDYENDERDEDTPRTARRYVNEMQADVDNTEYADEENETDTEDETLAPLLTTPSTTTTTTPAMTTTTTTTTIRTTTAPKPSVATRPPVTNHERRDSRSRYAPGDAQSNGLLQQPVHNVHKWQSPNARDSGKESKVHPQQNKNGKAEIKEALQHARKVSREGSCQWPRARVIPVREVYPSPSTTYIPHCAILHRCSDDTGCCRSEALTCVPKVSHRVELYFYTTSIGGGSVVEKLSFYNHTECECKERDEEGSTIDRGVNEHRLARHHSQTVSPPQNIRRPPQRKPCRCPSDFTPRITLEGECQCHCFENHQNCVLTRRGKSYFSLRDRLCIQNEECGTPACEFGEYIRRQGKCPRKKDRFDAIANHPINNNLHHRSRN